ncbi:MAG: ATP-sensitive inward rectifier potassium channel 10 [Myxococcales bacterium]|nr:ATP-sensitive inward rectifier potassium channel 10 [Myxococcales bacterium]
MGDFSKSVQEVSATQNAQDTMNTPVEQARREREAEALRSQDVGKLVQILGARHSPLEDLYASLLQSRWRWLFALAAALYLTINALFATAYWLIPQGIQGGKGAWSEAFFFSVQTFSTIGYGALSPKGLLANMLVTFEALVGLISAALVTGLIFAKFARPTARVLFSKSLVVHKRDGLPCLLFRVANRRGSNIVEANISMTVLLEERTKEGDVMKRLYDMKLQRKVSPVFLLSWVVIHPIDEESPLFGMSHEELLRTDARFFISLTGIDAVFAQTVHAYHFYWAGDVLWHHRFVDVIHRLSDGRTRLNLHKFHDAVPLPGDLCVAHCEREKTYLSPQEAAAQESDPAPPSDPDALNVDLAASSEIDA